MSSFREQGKGQKWIRSTRRPGASEVAKIKAKFAMYDEDHDGGINTEEFKKMLSSLGIKLVSEDQMELFGEMDVDKSGKIEIGEFLDHYYTILQLVEVCAVCCAVRPFLVCLFAPFQRDTRTRRRRQK